MSTQALPEVEVSALGFAAATATVWRLAGQLHVTVIAKGSFAIVPNGAMTPIEPEEILRADVHHNKNPMRSVRLSADLAPYLPRADVLLTGHAWAEGGRPVPSLSTRLVIFRDAALIDKVIHLHGDAKGHETVPFDRMPLIYERAYGGVGFDDNPLGTGFGATARLPNLADPTDPAKVACYAPIPRAFPARKRLLGATDRKVLDKAVPELPADFDWTYFQAAPEDQRIDFLRGDEWVILDGFHPEHTHLQSHLPGLRGLAQVHGLGDPEGLVLALAADTLRIDCDALTCSVVFRASFPVDDEALLGRLQISAGFELGAEAIVWPEPVRREPSGQVSAAAPPEGEVVPGIVSIAPEPEEDAPGALSGEVVEAAPESPPLAPPDEVEELDVDSVRTASLTIEHHVSRSHRPPPDPSFESPPAPPLHRMRTEIGLGPGSSFPPPAALPSMPEPVLKGRSATLVMTAPAATPPAVEPPRVEPGGATPAAVAPPPAVPAAVVPAAIAQAEPELTALTAVIGQAARGEAKVVPLPSAVGATAAAPSADEVAGERRIEAASRVTIRCGAATVTLEADGRVTLEGSSFELHAHGPVTICGEQVTVVSSGEVKVSATGSVAVEGSGPMRIDASGPVRLRGSKVGIN